MWATTSGVIWGMLGFENDAMIMCLQKSESTVWGVKSKGKGHKLTQPNTPLLFSLVPECCAQGFVHSCAVRDANPSNFKIKYKGIVQWGGHIPFGTIISPPGVLMKWVKTIIWGGAGAYFVLCNEALSSRLHRLFGLINVCRCPMYLLYKIPPQQYWTEMSQHGTSTKLLCVQLCGSTP